MEELDIKKILLHAKSKIELVEKGEISKSILKEIENDFYEFSELMKLFLISKRDCYYGYFMMNMTFEVDFFREIIAGVSLDSYPVKFISNPLLLFQYDLKEIIFIYCHEIEHLLLNHPAEVKKLNPLEKPEIYKKFNYAADASVNDRLIDEIVRRKEKYLARLDDCIDSPALKEIYKLDEILPLQSYLYYYNLIEKKEEVEEISSPLESKMESNSQDESNDGDSSNSDDKTNEKGNNSEGNNGSNNGPSTNVNEAKGGNAVSSSNEKSDGADNQSEDSNSDKNDENGENKPITVNDVKDLEDHNWSEDDLDAESIEEITRELINDVFNTIDSDRRSEMPSNFLERVKEINQPPKINWKALLKKYIGTIVAGKEKTRTRLNRRQPNRYDISGERSSKTLRLVIAIDTSGSLSSKDIELIFNEITNIIAKREYIITIIECDAVVQRVYEVRNKSDFKYDCVGRGGTLFTPVINYVNNHKELRESILIYFTDGFGEKKIPRPLTYKNIWVITRGTIDNLSVENPYGIVVSMEN